MFCSADLSEWRILRIAWWIWTVSIKLKFKSLSCSCDRRTKDEITKTTFAVGVKVKFLWCMRYIETALAQFVDARVQNQFDEYSCRNCISHTANNTDNFRKVGSKWPKFDNTEVKFIQKKYFLVFEQLQAAASGIYPARFATNRNSWYSKGHAGTTAAAATAKFDETNSIAAAHSVRSDKQSDCDEWEFDANRRWCRCHWPSGKF